MKEQLINIICGQLNEELSSSQLKRVNNLLNVTLAFYTLIPSQEKFQWENDMKISNQNYLERFLSAKKVEGCSVQTLKYYETTLKHFLINNNKSVLEASTEDIRGYLVNYQVMNNVSKVTLDNVRRIFSTFFAWMENEDYIYKSPIRRIHKVKEDKVVKGTFTDENIEVLRDNCTTIRDLALVDLLTSSGMRVGELVKLCISDIDFTNRECLVFGKGNKERFVYFDAKTKIHLLQYLESRKDDNDALFVSSKFPYERLKIGAIQRCLRKIGESAKVSKVHPHKFRRTMATVAIDKGMPIEQVQKLLGHVKIDTTMHYAIVNQQNVKMSHKKYIR